MGTYINRGPDKRVDGWLGKIAGNIQYVDRDSAGSLRGSGLARWSSLLNDSVLVVILVGHWG